MQQQTETDGDIEKCAKRASHPTSATLASHCSFGRSASDAQRRWLGFLGPLQLVVVRTLSNYWKHCAESESAWRPILDAQFPDAELFVIAGCTEDKAIVSYLQQCRLKRSMTNTFTTPSAAEFRVVVDLWVNAGRRVTAGCFSWEAGANNEALIIAIPPASRLPFSDAESRGLKISITVVRQADKKCMRLCQKCAASDVQPEVDDDGTWVDSDGTGCGYISFACELNNGHWPLVQSASSRDLGGERGWTLDICLVDLFVSRGEDNGYLVGCGGINVAMYLGNMRWATVDKFLAAMMLGEWVS